MSHEGQLAFVIAKLGLMVRDESGNWIKPTSGDDIDLTFEYSNPLVWFGDPKDQIKAALYKIGRDFPTNVALKNEIFVYDGWTTEDLWYDDDQDNYGNMFLAAMYNGILARANPVIAFNARKNDDTLTATTEHHLEVGDRVKLKTAPANSGLTAGNSYYVKDVVDAQVVKLSTTATGSVLDIKADGAGSLVEGPYGADPGRFGTEYDLLEHALDCMYAKQWSNSSADFKLALKESGKTSYAQHFYTGVDVLSDLSLAFTYGTRVVLPTAAAGKTYQNRGQYFTAGSATDLSGGEDQVARVRFSESMLNAAFYADSPYGTSVAQEFPFDCNSDGTTASDEKLAMTLSGRTPYVEMPTTAQGYDLVMEGLEMTMAPKGSCVLGGPMACLSAQSKPSDPVNAATAPVFLGRSRLAMRFATSSDAHVREAEDNYIWAQGGSNLCGADASSATPMAMLNEVVLSSDGAMVGNKYARAGCSGDALSGKLLETLDEKLTSATVNALKANACGTEYPVGNYAAAFQELIPIGIDLSVYPNVNAYCADTSDTAEVALTYVKRAVSDAAAVHEVLVGGPATSQVANTSAIAMVEWDGDGTGDLCGDEGIDLCPEYFLCGTCCPEGTFCQYVSTGFFEYKFECK